MNGENSEIAFSSDKGQTAVGDERGADITWSDMLDVLLFVREKKLDPDALPFIARRRIRGRASQYKGVVFEGGAWLARVQLPRAPSTHPVARFADEEQAAVAYDIVALAMLEDPASTNLPPQTYSELLPESVKRLIRIGLGHQYRELNNAAEAIIRWAVARAPHVAALRSLKTVGA